MSNTFVLLISLLFKIYEYYTRGIIIKLFFLSSNKNILYINSKKKKHRKKSRQLQLMYS